MTQVHSLSQGEVAYFYALPKKHQLLIMLNIIMLHRKDRFGLNLKLSRLLGI